MPRTAPCPASSLPSTDKFLAHSLLSHTLIHARLTHSLHLPWWSSQVVQANATDKFLAARRADQARALQHLREDGGPDGLASLQLITGPLCDLEVRGVPALQYFGNVVWK